MFSISGGYKRTGTIVVAAMLTGSMVFLYFAKRLPPIPQRTLRIGFEQNPPLQFHKADGLAASEWKPLWKLPNAQDCRSSGSRPALAPKNLSGEGWLTSGR